MEPYSAEAGFPVSGLAEVAPFGDQEVGTSPDMLNLVPFDSNGRLRGGRRAGLTKFCPDQVGGSESPVQCLAKISATYVQPVLGDGTVAINGKNASSLDMAFRANDGTGTITEVALLYTYLGSIFGPDGKCYVVEFTGVEVYLSRVQTDGTVDYTTRLFTAASAVAAKNLYGVTADEDTIYVWYKDIASATTGPVTVIGAVGEGIMRLNQSDGSNRDSTTNGCWIRAEGDATNIERVFGGVSGAGWDTIETTTHSCMVAYLGYLVVVGAPDVSTAISTNQLVVYIINTKTGIPDAVHDLGIDGSSSSTDRGIFIDLAFGLDGFIYVLYKDKDTGVAANTVTYLRKIAVDGTGIWELEYEADTSSSGIYSVCWVPDRNVLAVCGINVLGTGATLVLIDPDSKAIIDYSTLGSVNRDMVRCDSTGAFVVWKNGSANTVARFDTDFTQDWNFSDPNTNQNRASLNAFYNAGNNEVGSTRYQHTLAISDGVLTKLDSSAATAPTSGGTSFSASARVIYGAPFGVLCFFADGENHFYYDSVDDSVKDWGDNLVFGALPADMNGGFGYIEVWNNRVLAFGLADDPNNYYFSAQGDPFDWKLQQGVSGAAINGTLSPAQRFPENLVGAIPFNNDILIMCGDQSLWQFTLDPAVDGRMDLITDQIGMAPGRAWCKDGQGAVYFFGSNGGLYRMGLDTSPIRVSNRTIDDRLSDIDIRSSDIRLVWDKTRQGVWIFIHPHSNAAATQYFYDIRTEAFFPVKFATPDLNPVYAMSLDLDHPKDAKILLGGSDGYARYLDDTATTDDGTMFERYFVLGPWTSQEGSGMDVVMETLDVVVGADSYLKAEVLTGIDPQSVITSGRSKHTLQCRSGKRNASHPRISGRALALKLSTRFDQDVSFEGVRMRMRDRRSI